MNPPTKPISIHAGVDEYTTSLSEKFAVATSRLYKPDGNTPGIIYCHGFGGDGPSTLTGWATGPNIVSFGLRLAELGYPVLAGDFGGAQTWGNLIAMQRMDAARLWLQGPPYYAKPGKVVLIGGSMGAINAINYWRYLAGGGNAAGVNAYCVATAIPFTALEAARTLSPGGSRDSINFAWGLTLGSTSIHPAQVRDTATAWSAGTTYPFWAVVSRLGNAYLSTAVSTGLAPESNPTRWQLVPLSTSNTIIPTGAGLGDPMAHLAEVATMPYLAAMAATDDLSIDPSSVSAFANATLTKEAHFTTGFGGHSDATIGQADMANMIAFIARYAPLPTGGYV